MELKDIKSLCENLSKQKRDKFSVPVSVNDRFRTCLGRVTYIDNYVTKRVTPIKMEFSRDIINDPDDEFVTNIVKHEWAHYYLAKSTRKDHGHDHAFKKLCAEIGCIEDQTVVKTNINNVPKEDTPKYTLTCSCCGKKWTYKRKCKSLRDLLNNGCPHCHGKVNGYQNY